MSLSAKLLLAPLLVAQALHARARMPALPEAGGPRDGVCGRGDRLRLLVLGDSSAAGVGVSSQDLALAARLAQALAQRVPARVHWRLVARSGASSAALLDLLHAHGTQAADLAIVVSGVNDVIEQVPSHRAVGARERLVNTLRNGFGVQHVVFAPLPPVHQFPGLPQPLRWIAGADARRHDTALRRWAAARGDVSRADFQLALNPGVMAADGFHPGEPVYRQCAVLLAQHVARTVWPRLHLSA